jgi:hypothetical protein
MTRVIVWLARHLFCGLLTTVAYGQPSYYEVRISGKAVGYNDLTLGYANLNWADPPQAHGDLCVTGADKGKKFWPKVYLQVIYTRPNIIKLATSPTALFKVRAETIILRRSYSHLFDSSNIFVPAWEYIYQGTTFTFNRIPNDLRSLSLSSWGYDDVYYQIIRTPERVTAAKFRLNNYDTLSKKQVLAFEATNPPHVALESPSEATPSEVSKTRFEKGKVSAVVPRSRLSDLRRFLIAEGGGVFEDPSNDACGAPYVELEITVSSLLEFYYARKLQASGLVVTAYPRPLGAGPGFDAVDVDKQTEELISSVDVKFQEKQKQLSNIVIRNVRAFVEARRPGFKGKGHVTLLQGGQFLAFRMEIVGPALSECTRNRWEKLVLQIMPTTALLNMQWMYQFQEGFFAPGNLDFEPDDTRFQENRIPDGSLQKLQEVFGGFFADRGLSAGNSQDEAKNSDIDCRL